MEDWKDGRTERAITAVGGVLDLAIQQEWQGGRTADFSPPPTAFRTPLTGYSLSLKGVQQMLL